MVRALVSLSLLILFVFLPAGSLALTIKPDDWHKMSECQFRLETAKSCYGETIPLMSRRLIRDERLEVIKKVNGGYFGEKKTPDGQKILFPIGRISINGKDLSVCSSPPDRGYLWCDKDGILHADFNPLEDSRTKFVLSAGPILVYKGKMVESVQNFKLSHWNRQTMRTVVAINGDNVGVFRFYSSLWNIAKTLEDYGVDEATNLDGGSSTDPSEPVANGFFVVRKPEVPNPCVQTDWLAKLQTDSRRCRIAGNSWTARSLIPTLTGFPASWKQTILGASY